jgi:hypothetical protein
LLVSSGQDSARALRVGARNPKYVISILETKIVLVMVESILKKFLAERAPVEGDFFGSM